MAQSILDKQKERLKELKEAYQNAVSQEDKNNISRQITELENSIYYLNLPM